MENEEAPVRRRSFVERLAAVVLILLIASVLVPLGVGIARLLLGVLPDAPVKWPPEPTGRVMNYDWSLPALDGTNLPLSELRGRVIFLNLWATWCPPCRAEMASIQRLHDRLAGSDVAFVLLALQSSPEDVRDFVRKRGITAPVYLPTALVPGDMAPRAFPTTLIVARDGTVAFFHEGGARWDADAVADFLTKLAAAPGK